MEVVECLPAYMRLVVSGTGIKLATLEDMLVSPDLKPHSYGLVKDIGAFDDSTIQAEYIKRYVPMCQDEDNPHWAGFLRRAWAWLHGR